MTDTLLVAIILTDAQAPSSGECRLLQALQQNDRVQVTLFHGPARQIADLSIATRAVLAVEGAVLRGLGKAPQYSCPVGPVLPLDQLSAMPGAPDVIVDFTGDDLVTQIAAAARYGLWRLDAYTTAAGVHAAFRGWPSTPASLLQSPTPETPPRPIATALYDTKMLAAMNVMYVQEKSVQLIERELARLCSAARLPAPQPQLDPPEPGPFALPRYLGATLLRLADRVWQKLLARTGRKPGLFEIRVGRGSLQDFDPADTVAVPAPGNRFIADPFLYQHDGQTYLFFEDLSYDTNLGHIGVGTLDDSGFTMIGPAHTAPHHLSFPFVFDHAGDIFMLPETYQANRLEIWRATDFPTGWELYSTALDGVSAVDTVLTEIDGDWWLFTNICRDSFNDHCSELHIFRTDGPAMTRIEPHALNPVVIGADTARGGGRITCHDGRWYRVSQDNSGGGYGYGFNIMEIETLSLQDYREHRVRHVTPDFLPGLIGTHQFDAAGGTFVIDTRRARS